MPEARHAGQRYSLAFLTQARSLYVVKGMAPSEIARKLDAKPQAIRLLACRHGWGKEREDRLKRYENAIITRATNENASFLESMSAQSEELAEDSAMRAREALTHGLGASRELQQQSQSMKNFFDIWYKARGLDKQNSQVNISLTSIYTAAPEIAGVEKNVTGSAEDFPQLPT